MNNNEIAVYALVAIAALAIGYVFATVMAPAAGAAGNSTISATNPAGNTAAAEGAGKPVTVPQDKVATLKSALESYVNAQFGQKTTLSYKGATDNGEFITLNFTDEQGRPIPIPVSRDLNYMYGSAVKVDDFVTQVKLLEAQAASNQTNQPAQQPPVQLQKSDHPSMEVYVMSYCPYGLQMEKAVIPVQQLLGNKANISIRFVAYTMHGAKEVQENARQYCIMQNEPAKYWNYLSCFTASGDAAACMANQSIDANSTNACINATYSQYGITESGTSFPIDAAGNTKYGVQGSPTVVINGAQSNVARSPEDVKKALCAAFNTPPAECATTLSTVQASPGIGASAGSGTASGGCGT